MHRLRLPVAGLFVVVLSACGGGGSSTGGGGGTGSGLVPTAPAPGPVITADATVLRPIRDTAVWTYHGSTTAFTGATPVSYVTRTTQAATGGAAAIETLSNGGDGGPGTQSVSISGGTVGAPQSIDFAGKGVSETVPFIELRSPVRQGDQFTIWDRHYASTDIDADGDNKPDALDVAIFGRVIGVESLALAGLPVLSTVHVDVTVRARITLSSNGQMSPVAESVIQTWYARGIGIVRQRTTLPTGNNDAAVVDEQLSSWDGIAEGFGAMAVQTSVVPLTDALFGSGSTVHGTAPFGDHALVLMAAPFSPDSTFVRLDLRGQAVSSRIQPGIPAGSEGLVLPHQQGMLYLRQVQSQSRFTSTVELTRFDADGALVGNIAGATIDLTGPRTDPLFDTMHAAIDGTTLWLFWHRIYNTPFAQERELILRPYTLDGVPLGPELLVDPVVTNPERIAGVGGHVLLTWGRFVGNNYEAVYAVVALGDTTATVHTFVSGLPGLSETESELLLPRAGGASGALLWSVSLSGTPPGTTAGVLLDGNQNPVRAGSSLANEVLAGVPRLPDVGAAIDGTPDHSLLVLSVGPTVSWVTASAGAPLSTRTLAQVALSDTTAAQHVVFADRVLVLNGDADKLTTAVVWLNGGVAP